MHSFCNAGGFPGLAAGTGSSVANRHDEKQPGSAVTARAEEELGFSSAGIRLTIKSRQHLNNYKGHC